METKANMEYYEQLRVVPKEAQKSFSNGRFSGTDINPMWRIKRMTEIFGPCGIGWYYEVVNRTLEHSTDQNVICAFIGINLYINVNGEWSKPISNAITSTPMPGMKPSNTMMFSAKYVAVFTM